VDRIRHLRRTAVSPDRLRVDGLDEEERQWVAVFHQESEAAKTAPAKK
jgi:hypothetical protein